MKKFSKKVSLYLLVAIMAIVSFAAPVQAQTFDETKIETSSAVVQTTPVESYTFSDDIYFQRYSPVIAFTGNRLTSYVYAGPSSEISSVTIRLYRQYSPTASGRILVKQITIPTNGVSTLWFNGISIEPNADYIFQITPNTITANAPTRVIITPVSGTW